MLDIAPDDLARYSAMTAVQIAAGQISHRGRVESAISDTIERSLPARINTHGGFFMPIFPQAALDSGTSGAGEELVFTHPRDVVGFLYQQSKLLQLGAMWHTDGPFGASYPRETGATAWAWVAEDPGSDLGDSDLSLGSVGLTLRTLMGTTGFSRELLRQSKGGSESVDVVVARHLARGAATALDLAGVQGTGASNQPTGVLNTTGIGDVDIGANGGAPTHAHLVDLEHDVAAADADVGRLGFLGTPEVRRKLRKTESFGGAGAIWRGGRVLGYPAAATNQVPSNLTDGTGSNLHATIFGDWSQLILATLGTMEIVVDPYRLKKQGVVEVTAFLYGDVAVLQPSAFSAIQDINPS